MTTSADAVALLAAIAAHPEVDDPRLRYADWLQEFEDLDRAELIRVQCELHRFAPPTPGCTCDLDREGPKTWCEACCRITDLDRRESALLDAHPDWFRVKCPGCKGEGVAWQTSLFSGRDFDKCDTCYGSGNLHVTPRRGFAYSCAATMGSLFERGGKIDCAACNGAGMIDGLQHGHEHCPECGGSDYRPTEWLLSVVRQYPTLVEVVPSDREPAGFMFEGRMVYAFDVWGDFGDYPYFAYSVLLAAMDGVWIRSGQKANNTRAEAITALARAIVTVARAWPADSVSSPAA